VRVEGRSVARIGVGLLVLLGVEEGDTVNDARWLAEKTLHLRIFPDADGRMNRSTVDVGGEVLIVSQFTLAASTRRGRRPSYDRAAHPDVARSLYDAFIEDMRSFGVSVATGEFGAMMEVELVNDGPVTILLDPPGSASGKSEIPQ
jgi:D-tyrosyl-tRNA(Tyr) deacylase